MQVPILKVGDSVLGWISIARMYYPTGLTIDHCIRLPNIANFFGIWQVWISQTRSSTFWALILSFNNKWTSQSDLLHLGLNLFLSAISGTRILVQRNLVLLHSWFVPHKIYMFYTFSSGCEVDATSPRLPILQFCIRDQPVTANTYSRNHCVKFTYCGKLFSLNHEIIFCV